jgi:2-dehydro-3-deoxy-D-arabinonate dehydratase
VPAAAKTELAAPVGSQEVWAAGVTYRRSREARLEESSETRFYDRVYTSDRPELFFKAAGWRVVGPGSDVGVRADSTWDVPEPELAVLSNRHGEVVAYACGNDMSSRSIEGENPLFLPQAKVYDRSCAIGPAAVLAWTVDVSRAGMRMSIERDGRTVFSGTTSVAEMTREPAKLVAVLHAAYTLPVGAWLLTGTGIVPPEGYTARPGDLVRIAIDGLGELVNRVSLVPHSGAEARPTRRAAEHD